MSDQILNESEWNLFFVFRDGGGEGRGGGV